MHEETVEELVNKVKAAQHLLTLAMQDLERWMIQREKEPADDVVE